MLLSIRDVSVARDHAPVLRFPDLALFPGEKRVILGPSGSGKTTLLSVMAGLLRPSSGAAMFEGRDLYALPAHERDRLRGRHFGFVFQTLHLLPSLTLRQNVALAADMSGAARDEARIDALLEQLGLREKMHRKPESLSHGEQQRAAIARAALNKPRLLIADEPTSALDDDNAAAVTALLCAQAEAAGAALVIATHDARIVGPFGGNVLRLSKHVQEAA